MLYQVPRVQLSPEELRVIIWCLDTFEPLPTEAMMDTAERLGERLQELLDESLGTTEPVV